MKCPNCNETDHEPGAKYCHVCGALLKVIIDEPQKEQQRTRFIEAESFSEGLAMVRVLNGKAGFIDKTGKMAIAPRFLHASPILDPAFCDGLIAASVGEYPNIYYGIINHAGDFVIQPRYVMLENFSEELAPFYKDGLWGFLDKRGNEVIPAQYKSVNHFSEGLAAVEIKNQHFVYIDKTGQIVLDKTSHLVFSWNDDVFPIRKMGFSRAGSFHDGLARVECSGKRGLIDKSGKFTHVKYDNFGVFSEGLASFSINNYTTCGYFDKKLKVVIEPRFRDAGDFHNDRAVVYLDHKAGFIDKTGRVVIPCRFDHASAFSEGMAAIEVNKKYGYVDLSGNVTIPPRFDSVKDFSEGLAAVQENGYWGFIDKTGNYAF